MQVSLSNAVFGMQDAQRRAAISSHNLANLNTENFQPLRADGAAGQGPVDVASEVVDNMSAARSFQLNVKVAQAADETWKSLLDIRA